MVPTIRALTSLNVSDNNLGQLVAPEVLPEGWTQTNGYYKYEHTDGTRQDEPPGGKPEGAIAIANAISTMGAMKKLTISGNESWSKPVTIETSMTEADFSNKAVGVSGAIMLAAFLPKCR